MKDFRPRISEENKEKLLELGGDTWNDRVTNALSVVSLSNVLAVQQSEAIKDLDKRAERLSNEAESRAIKYQELHYHLRQVKQSNQQREESLKRVIANSEEDLKQAIKERQDWKTAALLTLATLLSALVYFGVA